ncbi:MAG: hypothetical protein HETSPECPRED_009532 [Heterodermia speciosa]|uniref:Isochorismatase-like domain-containing protein n=1 Tax=Heterodermia speciosa TaxID=116794 RepID=A0A8H3I729_9LECA|nr:MAG: hypothetical protein HETSPECPRED_009532 [Heterodermia speciosa]
MSKSHYENDNNNDSTTPSTKRALIGSPPNHWLWSSSPLYFDLTRPPPPEYPLPSPSTTINLSTTTTAVILDPNTSALLIIDMQNFFLSTCLGRPADGAGNRAARCLLNDAIPAARRAGIRIVWLNWGLDNAELSQMPPSTRRAFGFETTLRREAKEKAVPAVDPHGVNQKAAEYYAANGGGTSRPEDLTQNGRPERIYNGLGSEIGPVTLEDGFVIDGGRLLMRDTWNAALTPELETAYLEGVTRTEKPDVWIHKNRMSGLWGATGACQEHLEKEGVKTLLFAGVNTDQCVGGSLQDAFTKGWDCILLSDGCGTTSPGFATECVEFNCARTWGFVSSCGDLKKATAKMLGDRSDDTRDLC